MNRSRSSRGRLAVAVLAVVAGAVILGVLVVGRDAAPGPGTDEAGSAQLIAAAKAVIDTLPVKGRAPMTGYEREQFGDGWDDTDGCSTREDILRRDLSDIQLRDPCIVERGVLADPYSGRRIEFVRGPQTSDEVQIDHVVALANAWQTGAQRWDYRKRVAFANEPIELLAVDGDLNQQKGAGDAATWLPPNKEFRCQYVARQALIKDRWGLWLTAPEKQAIERELTPC